MEWEPISALLGSEAYAEFLTILEKNGSRVCFVMDVKSFSDVDNTIHDFAAVVKPSSHWPLAQPYVYVLYHWAVETTDPTYKGRGFQIYQAITQFFALHPMPIIPIWAINAFPSHFDMSQMQWESIHSDTLRQWFGQLWEHLEHPIKERCWHADT